MKKIKGTKKARERYQTLSKEGKEKKRQYGRKYQKNLLKDEKNACLYNQENAYNAK